MKYQSKINLHKFNPRSVHAEPKVEENLYFRTNPDLPRSWTRKISKHRTNFYRAVRWRLVKNLNFIITLSFEITVGIRQSLGTKSSNSVPNKFFFFSFFSKKSKILLIFLLLLTLKFPLSFWIFFFRFLVTLSGIFLFWSVNLSSNLNFEANKIFWWFRFYW